MTFPIVSLPLCVILMQGEIVEDMHTQDLRWHDNSAEQGPPPRDTEWDSTAHYFLKCSSIFQTVVLAVKSVLKWYVGGH